MELTKGVKFNTPFEQGCTVADAPDKFGNFAAIDSEGVECVFHTVMVCGFNHPAHSDVDHDCEPWND